MRHIFNLSIVVESDGTVPEDQLLDNAMASVICRLDGRFTGKIQNVTITQHKDILGKTMTWKQPT